jgi:D-aminoacyl-tRNA deacylase
MAPLFRLLYGAVREAGLTEEFEVTLEATHHGPWHGDSTPCCFVEIGSKEEDWGREDAARVWAGVLEESLGLSGGGGGAAEPPRPKPKAKAIVVGLGGGHYAPKMNDLLRHTGDEVLIGHMCANYCFNANGPPEVWQQGVLEAVAASKAAVDGDVPVVLYVDKKAFKAAQRNDLIAFLEAQGLAYGVKESEVLKAAERVVA